VLSVLALIWYFLYYNSNILKYSEKFWPSVRKCSTCAENVKICPTFSADSFRSTRYYIEEHNTPQPKAIKLRLSK